MNPWTRKYKPAKLDQVLGQPVEKLQAFATNFSKGTSPLLIYGPTGTGKTTAVHALAAEMDYEVIEINASDVRNKDAMQTLLGHALGQQSLFFKGKFILVDEIDCVSGTKDRGGIPAVVSLVKDAHFPVFLTANTIDEKKLKPLKKISQLVEFTALPATDIKQLLQNIVSVEHIDVDEDALNGLVHRSGGDARAAINDLQTLTSDGTLTKEDLAALGEREHKDSITHALARVFKTTKADIALPAFDDVDADIDTLFLWIDANLAKEYTKPEDLARAYDALAEADKFFGRIRRWQYYRFYVYIYNLLSAGIALAKDEKYPTPPKYKESSRILTIWIMNQKMAKKKAIAAKLGEKTHTSTSRALEYVNYLKGRKDVAAVAQALELTEDEAAWLS